MSKKSNASAHRSGAVAGIAKALGGGGMLNTAPLKFGDAGPSSAGQRSDEKHDFRAGSVNFGSNMSLPILPILLLVAAVGGVMYVTK